MYKLQIENVVKSFGSNTALKGVNMEVETGIYGLLGPNGAGKTTLMRIITTVIKADSGAIKFNDIDVNKEPDRLRKILGYLPQEFGCYKSITAFEFMDYIGILKGINDPKLRRKQIKALLEQVNLADHMNKKVGGFSGGMKRRLGIAQALLGSPQLIIVDEPTSGLDPEERVRFRNILQRISKDCVILLSTHIVNDIEQICSGAAVINRGVLRQFNTLYELSLCAEKVVWQVDINPSDFERFENSYRITSSAVSGNKMTLRILSERQPCADAVQVEPNVEEGYLAWIKKQDGISF